MKKAGCPAYQNPYVFKETLVARTLVVLHVARRLY